MLRHRAMVQAHGAVRVGVVQRPLALVTSSGYGVRTLSVTILSFVFEVVGSSNTIDRFIEEIQHLGLVDVSRTGIVAIARGADEM